MANLQIVIGPAIVLGLGQAAYIARMGRSSLLEVIREDYVRTARAKGLNSRLVIALHALPNALLPVITLSGVLLGFVLAGSIPVERAFGTPGLGYAMFHGGERARRLRHAEPGVPLCRRVRAAEHRWSTSPSPGSIRGSACDDRTPTDLIRRRPYAAAGRRARGASARGFVALVRRAPLSAFWGVIAALIIAMAVAAPVIAPYPIRSNRTSAPCRSRPSEAHWFGTDQIGRDTLSRVIYGSRDVAHRGARRGAVRHHAGRPVGPGLRLFRRPLRHRRASASSSSCSPFPT